VYSIESLSTNARAGERVIKKGGQVIAEKEMGVEGSHDEGAPGDLHFQRFSRYWELPPEELQQGGVPREHGKIQQHSQKGKNGM